MEVPRDSEERNYKTCKEWITIDTPEGIEEQLRDNKRRHFGQADGTFPTVPPFSEWVDWGASTHSCELILEGHFTSEPSPKEPPYSPLTRTYIALMCLHERAVALSPTDL